TRWIAAGIGAHGQVGGLVGPRAAHGVLRELLAFHRSSPALVRLPYSCGRASTGSAGGHRMRKLRSRQRRAQAIEVRSSKAEQHRTHRPAMRTSTSRPAAAHQNAWGPMPKRYQITITVSAITVRTSQAVSRSSVVGGSTGSISM